MGAWVTGHAGMFTGEKKTAVMCMIPAVCGLDFFHLQFLVKYFLARVSIALGESEVSCMLWGTCV